MDILVWVFALAPVTVCSLFIFGRLYDKPVEELNRMSSKERTVRTAVAITCIFCVIAFLYTMIAVIGSKTTVFESTPSVETSTIDSFSMSENGCIYNVIVDEHIASLIGFEKEDEVLLSDDGQAHCIVTKTHIKERLNLLPWTYIPSTEKTQAVSLPPSAYEVYTKRRAEAKMNGDIVFTGNGEIVEE